MKNPKLLKKLRLQCCFTCGKPPPVTVDHLVTRRIRGDEPRNLLPLCSKCHWDKGMMGVHSFISEYRIPVKDPQAIYPELDFEWQL